jgi:hypothetical protein
MLLLQLGLDVLWHLHASKVGNMCSCYQAVTSCCYMTGPHI